MCYNNCLTATVKITVYEVFLPDIHQHASVFLPRTANLRHTLSVAKEELAKGDGWAWGSCSRQGSWWVTARAAGILVEAGGTWLTGRGAGDHGIAMGLSEADIVNSWPSATTVKHQCGEWRRWAW